MVGNLIKADLQVATFIEVAHQLLGNLLIMRWNKGFQLPQEYLYQCFPRGDTRQHVKFVVTVNFCKAIVIEVVKLLVGAPQGVYRNVIVDGDFSTPAAFHDSSAGFDVISSHGSQEQSELLLVPLFVYYAHAPDRPPGYPTSLRR